MATHYIDKDGSNTYPYDTWAKAATSFWSFMSSYTYTAPDDSTIIYISHNTPDASTGYSGYNYIDLKHNTSPYINGLRIISVTEKSNPPTYQKGTVNQVYINDVTNTNTILTLYGYIRFIGVKIRVPMIRISTLASNQPGPYLLDCDIYITNPYRNLSHNGAICTDSSGYSFNSVIDHCNMYLDLTVSTNTVGVLFNWYYVASSLHVRNTKLVSMNTITSGSLVRGNGIRPVLFTNCDFSAATGFTSVINTGDYAPSIALFNNCTFPSSITRVNYPSNILPYAYYLFTNCGNDYNPIDMDLHTGQGRVTSSTNIYRVGGSSAFGVNYSWNILTNLSTYGSQLAFPLRTPWMSTVVSAGDKIATLYVTSDTVELSDFIVALEIEHQTVSNSPLKTITSSFMSTSKLTETIYETDNSSSWYGTGPTFYYKKKIQVAFTVSDAGDISWRACIHKKGISASAYFFIDPAIVIEDA